MVALTATQPPPPTIAEFAPQAVEQIEEAPSEQTSEFGTGDGGIGDGAAEATPAPTEAPAREVIEVARVRRCVGDPPRQIEDPQSPPCVPYWDGDNGGATWKGVTRDEIIVAWPQTEGHDESWVNAFVTFFNQRFEFYGRKITLAPFEPEGGGDDAALRADATKVDDELGAFASLTYSQDESKGGQTPYYNELSRRQILSVNYLPNYLPEGHLAQHQPYQWVQYPEFPQFQRHMGQWMCRALADRPARYAGAGTADERRVFGLIRENATNDSDIEPDATVLRRELERCDEEFAVDVHSESAQAGTVMAQMRAEGVTSIICFCDGSFSFGLSAYMRVASNMGYEPEWLLTDYLYQDVDFNARSFWPPEQAQRAFGITFKNKLNPENDMPFRWAAREGGSDGSGGDLGYYTYVNMLQLFSGIQMAGPQLTPQTFQAGMFGTTFPNPDCKGPPHYQSCVRYGPGDWAMQNDGTIHWWSNDQPSWAFGRGTFCYAHLGLRYDLGEWPSNDDGIFDLPCR